MNIMYSLLLHVSANLCGHHPVVVYTQEEKLFLEVNTLLWKHVAKCLYNLRRQNLASRGAHKQYRLL